jgi:hypothetical protein
MMMEKTNLLIKKWEKLVVERVEGVREGGRRMWFFHKNNNRS